MQRETTPLKLKKQGETRNVLLQKNSTHTLTHKQGIFNFGKDVTF